MKAGSLNEVITILRCVINKDDYGSETRVWEDYKTTKASKQFNSGNRVTEDNEIINSSIITFSIRIHHDVNEQMRLRYKGKTYVILSVDDDRLRQLKSIKCELVNE